MGLFQNIGNWWNDVTGKTERKAGQATAAAAGQASAQAGQAASGFSQQTGQQAQQIGAQAATARDRSMADMGTSAQDYMQKARTAGQQQAGDVAKESARQAIKASRTAGMTGGQAALAAGQNTGQAYQQGLQSGMDQYGQATQMGQQQAQMLANQQATQQNLQMGGIGQQTGAAATQGQIGSARTSAGQQQGQNFWGGVSDAAKTIGGWIASDEDVKKDIAPSGLDVKSDVGEVDIPGASPVKYTAPSQPEKSEDGGSGGGGLATMLSSGDVASLAAQFGPEIAAVMSDARTKYDVRASEIDALLDKVKPVNYRYKDEGDDEPKHSGVIAQDLEKVKSDAVGETEDGMKMINTEELQPLLLGLAQRLAGADGEQPQIESDAELQTTLLNYLLRAANKGGQ
jgi:hypothetical protein